MENKMGYVLLADAIVLNVVEDYRAAVKTINDSCSSDKAIFSAKTRIASLENWFRSEWGQLLSRGNGEVIINRLRKEIKRH